MERRGRVQDERKGGDERGGRMAGRPTGVTISGCVARVMICM